MLQIIALIAGLAVASLAQSPPYILVRVFPLLPTVDPVHLMPAGDNSGRLFVADKSGLIRVFHPDVADTGKVFLNARPQARDFRPETGLLGMAFHPDYADNGRFFLHYSGRRLQSVLAEYRVDPEDKGLADDSWERIILEVEQPSDMHNGGQIAFGPDGFLYLALGDGSDPKEIEDRGQDPTNLLGSILRIDVGAPIDSTYRIPTSNPFVGNNRGWREEIWAYGFRNPWRFSFHPVTGQIWVGDVGDREREEIDVVEAGGNYGWRRMEGTVCRDSTGCENQNLMLPAFDYGRDEGAAVIGGFVYQGTQHPNLAGAYVYGDFASRSVWALRPDGEKWRNELLAVSDEHILAFGRDEENELYVLGGNAIYRFESAVGRVLPPKRLSDTGLFARMSTQEPAERVVPYDVNAPLWSDGAEKRRYIALPANGRISYNPTETWQLPDQSTLIKSFYLHGRIVETRLLIKRSADPGWDGYSYMWNDESSEAFLLDVAKSVEYQFGVAAHNHYFPSRGQCGDCHTPAAGYLLGVRTEQLNRDGQLQAWDQDGLFEQPLPASGFWAKIPKPSNQKAAIEQRARAYLAANCANCHRPRHPIRAKFDLRYGTPLAETGLLDSARLGNLDTRDAVRIIEPGYPNRSLLYLRMIQIGRERMPPLATSVIDTHGASVVGRWIEALGAVTLVNGETTLALDDFTLLPPFPNPANAEVTIPFRLHRPVTATLELYNLTGQLLEQLVKVPRAAGDHEWYWNSADWATGVYLLRLEAGGRMQTRKLVLLR